MSRTQTFDKDFVALSFAVTTGSCSSLRSFRECLLHGRFLSLSRRLLANATYSHRYDNELTWAFSFTELNILWYHHSTYGTHFRGRWSDGWKLTARFVV